MSTDAQAARWDPTALVSAALKRGYRGEVNGMLILIGVIPAVVLTIIRAPGYESAPWILAAFWAIPTVLLVAWTPFDREGQAGREINMWFESVLHTFRRNGSGHPIVSAFESAATNWDRRSLAETATALRASLAPIVHGRLPIRFWIFEAQFFYLLLWNLVTILLIGTFVAAVSLSPECSSQLDSTVMCH